MHKGKLREIGTHQELLALRGIYWKLYQLQYKDQEIGTGDWPKSRSLATDPVLRRHFALRFRQHGGFFRPAQTVAVARQP